MIDRQMQLGITPSCLPLTSFSGGGGPSHPKRLCPKPGIYFPFRHPRGCPKPSATCAPGAAPRSPEAAEPRGPPAGAGAAAAAPRRARQVSPRQSLCGCRRAPGPTCPRPGALRRPQGGSDSSPPAPAPPRSAFRRRPRAGSPLPRAGAAGRKGDGRAAGVPGGTGTRGERGTGGRGRGGRGDLPSLPLFSPATGSPGPLCPSAHPGGRPRFIPPVWGAPGPPLDPGGFRSALRRGSRARFIVFFLFCFQQNTISRTIPAPHPCYHLGNLPV